jgi:hypothetical protein
MNSILFDSDLTDRKRLERLYAGSLFVFSPSQASTELCEHAGDIVLAACGGRNPLRLQGSDPEIFEAMVASAAHAFGRHPRSKELVRKLLAERGCDPERTYLSVPRLRIARPHKPRRDTWHAAAHSQINWRMPLYDVAGDNDTTFHPNYWEKAVPNDSERFDYYDRNARFEASAQGALELTPNVCLFPQIGGLTLSSSAHLSSTTPNAFGRTRWSIDFGTVNIDDVVAKRGARNMDAHPTGTSLREFAQARDGRRLSEDLVREYDDVPFNGLIFRPSVMPAAN